MANLTPDRELYERHLSSSQGSLQSFSLALKELKKKKEKKELIANFFYYQEVDCVSSSLLVGLIKKKPTIAL